MTNQNGSFPASNALTKYVKQVAKSTTTSSVFTFTATNFQDLFILNHNATSGSISITWSGGSYSKTLDFVSGTVATLYSNKFWQHNNSHINIPSVQDVSVTLTLTTTVSSTLQVGLLLGGYAIRCGDTENGLAIDEDGLKANIIALNAEYNMVKSFRDYQDFYAFTPYKDSEQLAERDGYIYYGRIKTKSNGNENDKYTKYSLEIT